MADILLGLGYASKRLFGHGAYAYKLSVIYIKLEGGGLILGGVKIHEFCAKIREFSSNLSPSKMQFIRKKKKNKSTSFNSFNRAFANIRCGCLGPNKNDLCDDTLL